MLQKLNRELMNAIIALKCKTEAFMEKEKGAVDIVAIVVLMGIVVLVAIIFRKQLSNLINNLFSTIGGTASSAITE